MVRIRLVYISLGLCVTNNAFNYFALCNLADAKL